MLLIPSSRNIEFPVAADPHPLTVGMEEELRGCFEFFLE